MAVRKIKTSWWVDFRANHQRYRVRSPENTRTGAQAYEAVLRQKLARGGTVHAKIHPALQEQTYEQFIWDWYRDYVEANNKFSEQRAKKTIIRLWLVPFFGRTKVKDITSHQIEQFKALQVKAGFSNKTIRNRLTVLHKSLYCAYEWLKLDGAPPKAKWPKCAPSRTDYLSAEECSLLIGHSDGVIREMILVALRTGMRQGELKGLQWQSIDWQNRIIVVRHSYCDVRKVLDTPKSNRERFIPMDIDVYEMLFNRRNATGFVFTDGDKSLNSQKLNLRLGKVCEKAGLRRITWHVLRHTFATHLAMNSEPLNTVQVLLGHSCITTTMRYAHVMNQSLRSAINRLNPKTAHLGQPVGNQNFVEKNTEALSHQIGGR